MVEVDLSSVVEYEFVEMLSKSCIKSVSGSLEEVDDAVDASSVSMSLVGSVVDES